MNYQEAIGKLLYIKRGHIPDWGNKQDEYYSMHEAINTAISAMQELKEYKEYGTPNGYKSALEAYDKCYSEKEIIDTELYKYQQIGTLEEVRESVEKQKAKKPLVGGNTDKLTGDIRICPCCCGIVGIDDMRADYCADCGQHIDWSEVEE